MIVIVLVQVGEQETEEKVAVVPTGRPVAEKETDPVVPERRVVVIEFVTDWPWVTDLLPPLVTEKSKVGSVPTFNVAYSDQCTTSLVGVLEKVCGIGP